MIRAVLYTAADSGGLCGFKLENHGVDIVCAAVSMLAINTVNSLETLTDCRLEYLYDESGGYIECLLPGPWNPAETLLMQSFALGLRSVEERYGNNETGVILEYAEAPRKIKHPKNKNVTEYKR